MTNKTLDSRNRVTDAQLDKIIDQNDTCWVLQHSLVIKDLQARYPKFVCGDISGILYRGCVIATGSDRADAYLYNAGSPVYVMDRHASYRAQRRADITKEMKRLGRELDSLR